MRESPRNRLLLRRALSLFALPTAGTPAATPWAARW